MNQSLSHSVCHDSDLGQAADQQRKKIEGKEDYPREQGGYVSEGLAQHTKHPLRSRVCVCVWGGVIEVAEYKRQKQTGRVECR